MVVLLTGGLGYIGSHTACELIKNGYQIVVVDNLSNAKYDVLNRIETITGIRPHFYKVDILDEKGLQEVFQKETIDAVIHFAGLKAVGESCKKPDLYHHVNVDGTKTLLKVMKEFDCKNIVFSSSATVYGCPNHEEFYESDPITVANSPYGNNKIEIENILKNLENKDPSMNIAILRYFNPIGAHESGLIGEDPKGIPNNLFPYICQVAIGKLPYVQVFGDDYKTVDGTGVRDYIHVLDLAHGHLLALKKLETKPGLVIYNLGTGKGTSVLELIHAFKEANNIDIQYKIVGRRDGDIDCSYANVNKAKKELGFIASFSIKDACRDSWNFQKKNPQGILDEE